MKKVLVIGDANSIFIKQYVENVLCKNGMQVVLIKESYINASHMKDYEKLGVCIESRDVGIISKIPLLRTWAGTWLWCKKIRNKYGKFDIVHVHGLNRFRGSIGNRMKKYVSRYVLSVWGDEILRGNDERREYFRKFYDKADVITISTLHVREAFKKAYGTDYMDKVRTCRFGLSVFDKIDEIEKVFTREEIFEEFGIADSKKITVLVGYNGREQQNLIELTQMLQTLSPDVLEKIIAVYTFTYGKRSEEYDKRLKSEMDKLNCEKLVLTEFMNEETSAKLRCISDVMLHAQQTDAFSASVQECLYCGALVFNGEWLHYHELNEAQIKLITFNDYNELAELLPEYIQNYSDKASCFENNRRALRSLSSQEVTEKAWLQAISVE